MVKVVGIYHIFEAGTLCAKETEVCRCCAEEFIKKGYTAQWDGHLQKYIEITDGVSMYGTDEPEEISCSQCGDYFEEEDVMALLGNN